MRYIFALAVILCSCGTIKTVNGVKVKEKKQSNTKAYVFVMVTGFMLGFVLTDEYLIEK